MPCDAKTLTPHTEAIQQEPGTFTIESASPSGSLPVLSSSSAPESPRRMPLTLEQIEKNLEAQLGVDVKFVSETIDNYDLASIRYLFQHENDRYCLDKTTGAVCSYTCEACDFSSDENIGIENAEKKSYEMSIKFCPEFFEYNYCTESYSQSETAYIIVFYQMSEKEIRTGNYIKAKIMCGGTIQSISIFCDRDPAAADMEYNISKEQATEAAYGAAKEYYDKINRFREEKIDLEDRTNHETIIYLRLHKETPKWFIEIKNFKNKIPDDTFDFETKIHFLAVIDANTGEILDFSTTR